jgi:hypothetical protein
MAPAQQINFCRFFWFFTMTSLPEKKQAKTQTFLMWPGLMSKLRKYPDLLYSM